MARTRKPTSEDLERMNQAVALVTAYDLGEGEGDYKPFAALSDEVHAEHGLEALRAVSQFAWMLLESMEAAGVDKSSLLAWYGERFADRAEELRG